MKTTRCFAIVLVATCHGLFALADTARVEVQVVDETTGRPIKDVDVCGSFEIRGKPWDYVKGSPSPNFDYGRTDSQGRCKLIGKTNCGNVSCFLKSGPSTHYWMHRGGGCQFTSKNFFGVWQPDNLVVTIKLQRVEHPIPLWVKNVQETGRKRDIFKEGNGRIQFDFLVGDWLPPVGKGKVADVEFVRLPHEDFGEGENDGIKANSYRNSMSVKFLGADNGLLEMSPEPYHKLKIRTAPESGYRPEYFCWKGRSKKLVRETSYDKDRCFCFRVRTRRNADGTIREAYYGKIYGDIIFGFKNNPFVPVATVQMLYYLNPTSLDRNLEWDREANLCPNPGDVGDSVGDRQP